MTQLLPGTVIVTATTDKGGWWIRARSRIRRRPARHNHVALYTHTDDTGRPRGIEGRPGGVGWANLERYLARPDTITNVEQPLGDDQRRLIVRGAISMLGIPYDWEAIIAFAATTAGFEFAADEWPVDGVPSHVVCSSAMDYLYEAAGVPNPGGYAQTRGTDPDDWSDWIIRRGWQT